ncbi:MAG: DNA-3-methyladenine glycosylase [Bacteroidota bacterium]
MEIEALKDRPGQRLRRSFYIREDVITIAQELLGKVLVTDFGEGKTGGIIVETEAYRAPEDQASHAANNRRTKRTETMYAQGGHCYVYLIYGIHHLFNVVTGPEDMAHAVLIRGLEPIDNINLMLQRRNMPKLKTQLSAGPGVLSKALGINTGWDRTDLVAPNSPIWLEDRGVKVEQDQIQAGTRVGVAYAGEDAFLPWRFSIKESKWVSPGRGVGE